MRVPISLLLASFFVTDAANAKNEQVARGPAPNWAVASELLTAPQDGGGLAFFRRQDILVHLDATGQQNYTGYRIKILHPNALQLGNLSISWNPSVGAPMVHSIKIHRGADTIDVLEKASFEVLRRENQLEQAKLDGTLTAVFRVGDLRVGDELEFNVTTRSSDPTLGNNDSGLLFLAPTPTPGRIRIGLSWDSGQEPKIKMTEDMAAIAARGDRQVEFLFDNPKTLTPPKEAPPRYKWQRIVEFSDFADWASVSRHFSPLFGKASKIGTTSRLSAEVSRIAAAHANSLDRAKAALKLVQQDVRYIYVGLAGGNLTPASAEETWERRYGDCKGKTALLLALLSELGIKAEAVLASNAGSDDGLEQRLPNIALFDHVLVRAQIEGKTYWLDGTMPSVALPSQVPILPYRWVLPISTQGSPIERVEQGPKEVPDEINLYEIDAREGFDKPALITSTEIVRGLTGLQRQVQFSALTPAQLLEGLRQDLIGETWQVIDDIKWRFDERAQASILTITGKGTVDWEEDGDGAKSLSLPGGGFSPPEKRIRASDQKQDAPYYQAADYSCHVTTVRLPTATLPKQWWFNSQFNTQIFGENFYRVFELRDRAIRMIRGSRVEKQEIDAATARADNARIGDFDNSKAWIYFDPGYKGYSKASVQSVAATYDIDWTADTVPCLAPEKDR